MTRRDLIMKDISVGQRGIEVGPWFNPLAPKREGYNCLSMDVFDTETLRSRANADPHITAQQLMDIEDVDLVGSSIAIGDLIEARGGSGTFDYIVSSHNFEHLPNPIRFLNGCASALKPGGMLRMAIPDHRICFDYFRPITRLSDWIQSFYTDQHRPSLANVFEGRAVFAHYLDGGRTRYDFFPTTPAETVRCDIQLAEEWDFWASRVRAHGSASGFGEDEYVDAHCSVFTPASFELLVRDCGFLGLTRFAVAEVASQGYEFHASLQPVTDTNDLRPEDYATIRTGLLHRIRNEEAENSGAFQKCRQSLEDTQAELRRLKLLYGVT
ncbi:class I SAM-dependent methyltransferase [Lichenicoccus sp.]|uniref:class I SAM-dependent methyltransferase n=1 Tax=Lichenicoccus sp. TaxID=2781899 RepID=UPI003D0CD818